MLQNQQVVLRRIPCRGKRNTAIESDEPSFVLYRKSKEVYVGKLPRSMDSRRIDDVRIQQSDFIRPEFMDVFVASIGQMLDDSLDRQRAGIARIRHDSDTAVLRDGTGCPTLARVLREPTHR